MQEFRPATVIAADTELAVRIRAGDRAAIRSLIHRYGAAVMSSVAPTAGVDDVSDVAVDVFVCAVQRPLPPGDDFAPWLAAIAGDRAGAVDERRWELAMAVGAIDPSARAALRAHHVDRHAELDDHLARHELRLQRRLAHLGEPEDVIASLAEPDVWVDVVADTDVVDRVLDAVGVGAEPADAGDDRSAPGRTDQTPRVTRGLRPLLFGLAGAVAVLFVAIVGLSVASGTPAQPDFTIDLTPTGAVLDVEGGEITVTERDAGIEIDLDAITLPRRAGGLYYEGRLVLADGTEISAGTFSEGDGVTLWGGVALDDAVAFRIVLGDVGNSEVDDLVLKADLPRS